MEAVAIHAQFIRVTPYGNFVPELALKIRNQTSLPWRILKLQFDIGGLCNGDLALPVLILAFLAVCLYLPGCSHSALPMRAQTPNPTPSAAPDQRHDTERERVDGRDRDKDRDHDRDGKHKETLIASKLAAPQAPPGADDDEDDDEAAETAAADWDRLRRVAPGETQVSWRSFAETSARVAAMPRVSVGTSPWASLGPGVVSGRTRSLLIDPQNPNTMYAGAVTGGVWKSTDAGQHWVALTDGLPNLTVGAMAMDPADSSTLYAGQGEEYSYHPGLGIYKSSDAGATWTLLAGTAQSADFAYVNRIVVSPLNSQRIYAATGTGILASRDGGATWTKAPINASFYGCTDLVARSDVQTDYLFAFCSSTTATSAGSVYRNTDAGNAGAWASVLTAPNMGRSSIALAPSNQTIVYVAAAEIGPSDSDEGFRWGYGLLGVFRSASAGDPGSWVDQTSATDPNPFNRSLFISLGANTSAYCASGAAATTGYGVWGQMLVVDPLDPNRVWAAGVDLLRSDDGGLNWGVASRWDLTASPSYSHADRHGLIFSPSYDGTTNQTAYHITDGGIFRTDNAAAAVSTGLQAGCTTEYVQNNQVTWTTLNTDYSVTEFTSGSAYPGGQAYAGGSQDTGVVRGIDGGFNSWPQLSGGDGFAAQIDPIDPNRMLIEIQDLSLSRSVDGGVTFSPATQGIVDSEFPFAAYLAVDPNDSNNVYVGGGTNLWRSADWAAQWMASAATGASGTVSAISVSPFDSNTVLFGTFGGAIFRSTNALSGPGTWTSTQPRNANVSSIAFDPVTPDLVYAVYSNLKGANASAGVAHVYRSADGGQTWTPSDGAGSTALPDVPTWRILVNPRTPQTLYLGSDQGLMVSTDGGATWGHEDALPSVIVDELAFDSTAANYLFAFTYGRGLFRTPLPGSVAGCAFNVSPQAIDATTDGGVYSVNVSTGPGCAWSAVLSAQVSGFSLQSPAQGLGPGTAWVVVPPADTSPQTIFGGGSVGGAIFVAGQTVTVTQPPVTILHVGADLLANAPVLPVPSQLFVGASGFTSSPDDPVHSCTGSADFGTAWWQIQPNFTGLLNLQGRGDRLDVFGNSGMVLTAYAAAAPNAELGCVTVPRDTGGRTLTGFQFSVTAGQAYFVEMAATTAAGVANTNYDIAVSMGSPAPVVSVAPLQSTVTAGSGPVTLSATVTGVPNQTVRWSIAPEIGRVSQAGGYTPPASVSAPTVITVTATAFADHVTSASSTVTIVPPGPAISITAAGLVSAASYQGGGVAPGEIATLFGMNLGPAAIAGAVYDADGNLTDTTGGTSVTFDGTPAPMIYSLAGQISFIVPYSVAGKTTSQMQVTYNGQQSAPLAIPIMDALPGLFTANGSGVGNAAALNQDSSINSAVNPAARGSVIVLYGSGEGQTNPPGVDGRVNRSSFPSPVLPVSVSIGGVNAQAAYFGAAPFLVSGVFQANVVIPAGIPAGSAEVIVTVGSSSSPRGVTIAVN